MQTALSAQVLKHPSLKILLLILYHEGETSKHGHFKLTSHLFPKFLIVIFKQIVWFDMSITFVRERAVTSYLHLIWMINFHLHLI